MYRMTNTILGALYRASNEDWDEGKRWYRDAHNYALRLGPHGPGVIAALSPNNHWDRNKEMAYEACKQGHAKGVGHTGLCETRATAILLGAQPLDVLGGRKTRSFYRNISEPDREGPVTIDRHAFEVAGGSNVRDLERIGVYAQIAGAYRAAGRQMALRPQEAQAITWIAHRKR